MCSKTILYPSYFIIVILTFYIKKKNTMLTIVAHLLSFIQISTHLISGYDNKIQVLVILRFWEIFEAFTAVAIALEMN